MSPTIRQTPLRFTAFALAAFAVALPQVATAQSNMGWALSMTTATDSANGHTPATMVMAFEMLGTKSRIAISGTAFPAEMGGMLMVTDSASGTMTNIMAGQHMAMIMDKNLFATTKPSYRFEIVGVPVSKTEDLGAGQPVAGHATHHYRTTATSETKWIFGDESCSKKSKTVTEMWTVAEPNSRDLMEVLLKMASANGASPLSDSNSARLDSLKRGAPTGRPLMEITTTSVPTAKGDSVISHSRMQFNEIQKREIDPADFEIPAGYMTMDMREMMKGMDPAMMSGAMGNVSAAMKKNICG